MPHAPPAAPAFQPAHVRAFHTDRCSMCTPAGAMLTAIKWKPRRTGLGSVKRAHPGGLTGIRRPCPA